MKEITIGNRKIGNQNPVYFIADIGANHNGDLEKAKALIYLAKEAGADAAKFQNFQAAKIVSKYGFDNLGGQLSHQAKWKKSVFEVYEDASISKDWTPILKETCEKAGIDYFTSAYDFESVDLVDPYVDVYKIGSGDITWTDILEYTAQKNKPMLLATGASSLEDVQRAMAAIQKHTEEIVLMQCNTNYTGSHENFKYINLNVLNKFKELYPYTILGLSDHTPGHATTLGAVAMGARAVEKHFTDNNNQEGPDHGFAMNPKTWREMVDRTEELMWALGDGVKRIEENEKQSIVVQRRSIRATKDLASGNIITKESFESLRPIPEDGLPPHRLQGLVGKKMVKSLKAGEHLTLDHIES